MNSLVHNEGWALKKLLRIATFFYFVVDKKRQAE